MSMLGPRKSCRGKCALREQGRITRLIISAVRRADAEPQGRILFILSFKSFGHTAPCSATSCGLGPGFALTCTLGYGAKHRIPPLGRVRCLLRFGFQIVSNWDRETSGLGLEALALLVRHLLC